MDEHGVILCCSTQTSTKRSLISVCRTVVRKTCKCTSVNELTRKILSSTITRKFLIHNFAKIRQINIDGMKRNSFRSHSVISTKKKTAAQFS